MVLAARDKKGDDEKDEGVTHESMTPCHCVDELKSLILKSGYEPLEPRVA